VDAFDISEAMLDVAAGRMPGTRVRWLHSEFEQFTCALTYPLVVSSSSLHWAPSLSAAVGNLATCLAPGGTLAASIMVDGTFRELRACREIVAPGKPMRRPMPVLADLTLAVDEKELVRADSGHYEVTIRHDSARDFFQCIHEQGLTGGRYFRPIEPLTCRELDALADEYDRRFPHPDGGIQATYVIGWVVARSRA
jgi:trans-aconitate methyltransferase